jgi:hypothetical protein
MHHPEFTHLLIKLKQGHPDIEHLHVELGGASTRRAHVLLLKFE